MQQPAQGELFKLSQFPLDDFTDNHAVFGD
jgi:hypothetical protein